MKHISAFMLVLCSSASGASTLNLVCQGTAEVDSSTSTYWKHGVITTESRINIDDSVGIKLEDDGNGTARIPRRMLPLVRTGSVDGWFPLIHVVQSADEITAQVRLNQYNKPRIHLDRITGRIRIDGGSGSTGDFSGQCEAYDPEKVQRKF